eukprot:UN26899
MTRYKIVVNIYKKKGRFKIINLEGKTIKCKNKITKK